MPNAHRSDLTQLLRDNPHLVAAWIKPGNHTPKLVIITDETEPVTHLSIPATLANLPCETHRRQRLRPLIALTHHSAPQNAHQACQDEPIQLGCQIQPEGANWVGTAGLPCTLQLPGENPVHGWLTNYHVAAMGLEQKGRPQYQPDDRFLQCGSLHDWEPITPDRTHLFDAAFCDAKQNGYHTISPSILEIGPPAPDFADLEIGDPVQKSGRTTALTLGLVEATGVAVRVDYGQFTATFADQDIIIGTSNDFSAPGDSGSAVLTHPDARPAALLFAGGGGITVANPIRHVLERFPLQCPLK